jgi:hypothetical protein
MSKSKVIFLENKIYSCYSRTFRYFWQKIKMVCCIMSWNRIKPKILLLLLWRFGLFSGHGLPNQPSSSTLRGFSWGFETNTSFTRWACQPHAQPPASTTRVSLFVSAITFDLSDMGAPASGCATAGIALRILWPRKPRHYVKVGIPSAGSNRTIKGQFFPC